LRPYAQLAPAPGERVAMIMRAWLGGGDKFFDHVCVNGEK